MKTYLKTTMALCMLVLLLGCEEFVVGPQLTSGQTPKNVSNVTIKNLNGGAKLTYTLPNSDDLLYVKAVYEYPKGKINEIKSSKYVDTLMIEGIASVSPLKVDLYSVSRAEINSEPLSVLINPTIAPVHMVVSTLTVDEDFGGFRLGFENTLAADIIISVLKFENNEWSLVETFYTNKKNGPVSVRGQEAEMTQFGIYIRDKWRNHSDTLIKTLKPYFEQQLEHPTPIYSLMSDYNEFFGGYSHSFNFDDIISDHSYSGTLLKDDKPLPHSFTMDFKVPTKFSRYKLWWRPAHIFDYASPEKWELYGSNVLVDDFNQWDKIGDYVAVKPSGSPYPILTALDRETASAGMDFIIPSDTPPYRYLRWKTTKTFGGLNAVQISELHFWHSYTRNFCKTLACHTDIITI